MREKDLKENQLFKSTVDNLNEGWKSGLPQEILDKYMNFIETTSAHIEDARLKLIGLCAVANVKYIFGQFEQAYELAEKNCKDAGDDFVLKWMASYAYFTTILFRGDFNRGMELMDDHWLNYYKGREQELEEAKRELSSTTVNPVWAVPRHLILAAAFKGSPEIETDDSERYWPWPEGARDDPGADDPRRELRWVTCWYEKAQEICDEGMISLQFSHAYAGFYYTLLYLDSQGADSIDRYVTHANWLKKAREIRLCRKAEDAFGKIEETSPQVSRYVKAGFYGIFKLVTEEDPEEALADLREAARLSATSDNRFGVVDFLFNCCHAVAAQRVEEKESEGYLRPEVNQYLEKAGQVAKEIGHHFYSGLYAAAYSEVRRMRGHKGRAERFGAEARNKMDPTGERILRIVIDEDKNNLVVAQAGLPRFERSTEQFLRKALYAPVTGLSTYRRHKPQEGGGRGRGRQQS